MFSDHIPDFLPEAAQPAGFFERAGLMFKDTDTVDGANGPSMTLMTSATVIVSGARDR